MAFDDTWCKTNINVPCRAQPSCPPDNGLARSVLGHEQQEMDDGYKHMVRRGHVLTSFLGGWATFTHHETVRACPTTLT